MSDNMPNIPPGLQLTQEQIEAISGGDGSCTAEQWVQITGQVKQAYENLVEFTSYVMERIATGGTNANP
jgi:hypothetical protein